MVGASSTSNAVATARRIDAAELPPGPRGKLATTIRYVRDPYGTLLEAARQFGDPFTMPHFGGPIVVTSDPVGIKEVITADPDIYRPLGAELLSPVIGASSIVVVSGDAHRAMRKFYNPHFHRDRMQAFGAQMSRIAAEHAARWPLDRPFPIEPTMREIALEVILQVVLGLGDPEARAVFRRAVLALMGAMHPSFVLVPSLRRSFLGLSPWARYQRKMQRVFALVEREVALRNADPGARSDVLSLLIAAGREDGSTYTAQEILEQIMTMIAAGHETTGSALTWALFHIHRDESVKARLLDELRDLGPAGQEIDPAQVSRLSYLDAVCCETLRLEPAAPLVGRTLRESLTLKGHVLPASVSVSVGIINLHRRPDLYPQPERFWPDRFLEHERGPFDFLPFGYGPRRCIGAAFAMYELKIVLATILRAHALRLTDTRPVRGSLRRSTTVSPSRQIAMVRT